MWGSIQAPPPPPKKMFLVNIIDTSLNLLEESFSFFFSDRFKRRIFHAPNLIQITQDSFAYLYWIRQTKSSTFETGLRRRAVAPFAQGFSRARYTRKAARGLLTCKFATSEGGHD